MHHRSPMRPAIMNHKRCIPYSAGDFLARCASNGCQPAHSPAEHTGPAVRSQVTKLQSSSIHLLACICKGHVQNRTCSESECIEACSHNQNMTGDQAEFARPLKSPCGAEPSVQDSRGQPPAVHEVCNTLNKIRSQNPSALTTSRGAGPNTLEMC